MAQKLIFVDDMNDEEGARPFIFSVEGVAFEIDLVEDNTKMFYEAIAPFVAKARRTSRSARIPEQLREIMGPQTTVVTPTASEPVIDRDLGKHTPEEVADCRAWLARIGVEAPPARFPLDMWKAWRANDPALLKKERLQRGHTEDPKTARD